MRFIKSVVLSAVFVGFGVGGASAVAAPPVTSISNPIALQMYTLRNVGTLEQQLAMAKSAGFRKVEVVGNQGVTANELKFLLDKYELSVSSSHEQLSTLRNDLPATIAFNQAIGNRVLVLPWLEIADRPTDAAGWRKLGAELDRLGARLREYGMKLAYHNHDFEMKKYQDKTAYEWLVSATKPENLLLEVDVAWVFRGGQDPARFIRKYAGRLFAIHAKDNSGIGIRDDEMNFAPLGEGLLDWDEIIPTYERTDRPLYIVEHDLPKDPLSIITTARQNLIAELRAARVASK
ncbi:sugar phosphate isomerase/epimerase family protein [Pseudomonas sp. NPDC089734]|uniref:sugar phosphate isomerase/epimerase family protein n=1 Tax=Pseudomonas sp. NPDC089734 TaxID=3364469 RepID=UPI0037F212B9